MQPTEEGSDTSGVIINAGSTERAAFIGGRIRVVMPSLACLEIDDEQPEVLMDLAEACIKDDDPASAQFHLERVARMLPDQPDILHNLGVCHFMQNNWQEGIDYCQKALELNEKYLPALHKLAIAYISNSEWALAREMIKRGLAVEPENEKFQYLSRRLRTMRINSIVSGALWPVKTVGQRIGSVFGLKTTTTP